MSRNTSLQITSSSTMNYSGASSDRGKGKVEERLERIVGNIVQMINDRIDEDHQSLRQFVTYMETGEGKVKLKKVDLDKYGKKIENHYRNRIEMAKSILD